MAASILPSLQCILQQNGLQREEIIKLIKHIEQSYAGKNTESIEAGAVDILQAPPATTREKELHLQVIQLQQSIGSLVDELQRQKMQNVQLERRLSTSVPTTRLPLPMKRFKICHSDLFSLDLDGKILNKHYDVTNHVASSCRNRSIDEVKPCSTRFWSSHQFVPLTAEYILSLSTVNGCRLVTATLKPSYR
ncbi:hypothetical protein KIW84_010913 [Lathyrus oleraceus]|uniref:Uncharacterized protein n=1 Tax=Pisum sativum TaxID=3888 RepID=A0A9D5BEI7_PEA|nr:hypothetical protein KIW84_010913 [Pisum sativum]